MRFALACALLLLCAAPSLATQQVFLLNPYPYGTIQPIDLGGPVAAITGVTLQAVGDSSPTVTTCSSMEGTYTYVGPYNFTVAFVEDGAPLSDPYTYFCASESAPFDVTAEITAADWSFLTDGLAGFQLTWESTGGGGGSGYCSTALGHITFESLILTVEYQASVAGDAPSWDALKALYR